MYSAFIRWTAAVLLGAGIAVAQEPAAPARPAKPAAPSHARATAYLGVDIRDVTPDRAGPLKLKENRGVEVTMVDHDSPAGKAGLKEHDVILSFNGQPVTDAQHLRRFIRGTEPGRAVTLGISRDGQLMNITPTLAKRDQALALALPGRVIVSPEVHVPAMAVDLPQFSVVQFWGRNGMVVEDLTPQLGEFFGVRDGGGVLVRSVQKGSAAEAAGMKAGDVIVKVNGEHVSSGADWRHATRGQNGGTVTFSVIRDRHEQAISMKVPERKTTNGYRVDIPDLSPDMEKMYQELQRIGPEIQRSVAAAQAEAAREVERAMRDLQRELDQAQREQEREMRDQQREMQRSQRDRERAQRERERAQQEQQRELQRQSDELQKQQNQTPPPPAAPPAPPQ